MIRKQNPPQPRAKSAPDHNRKETHSHPRPSFRSETRTHRTVRSPLTRRAPTGHSADISKSTKLRFVPLGGLEEIGLNMMFFEYQNEIVVIDAGLLFPVEETPGIDFIIPNVSYLESKKANIHALIITHGHYDHIGAIPYVMNKLGHPPIYTTSITKAIIEKRQEDFPNVQRPNIIVVKNGEKIKLSNHFEAEFFGIAHTIPEAVAVNLKTPVGNVVNLGDFKIENDGNGNPTDVEDLKRIGKEGVHLFTIDSTNADKPGFSESERNVEKNLEELIRSAEGRIIVAMFASVLTRIGEVIKIAEKLGRVVALSGYSMKSNVEIAKRLGFIKSEPDTMIPVEEIHKYKDNKILILSTGAQGESNASLMKIINGEHRFIRIKPGDTVMFSASVIPGNERSVQGLKDNLARQGALIFTSDIIDIHASGHAPKEDLKIAMKLLNPKFLAPIHGYFYKRSVNAKSGVEVGIPRKNIFLLDNGQVAEITKDTFEITKEEVPASYVMVDGLGVGDVEEVVLRDRKALANEGMVVIILALEKKTARLIKSPDIISRGFIYIKENQEVLEEVRKKIRSIISRLPNYQPIEPDYLKTLIRDQVGQFLYTKTKRRPMILPVVIEI